MAFLPCSDFHLHFSYCSPHSQRRLPSLPSALRPQGSQVRLLMDFQIPRLRQQSSSPFADLWSLDQKMLPLAWQIHHLCQILNILSLPCRCYLCLHCPFVVILEVVFERRDVGFELRMARDVIWENEGIVVLLGGRSKLVTSLGRFIWIDSARE